MSLEVSNLERGEAFKELLKTIDSRREYYLKESDRSEDESAKALYRLCFEICELEAILLTRLH